MIIAGRQRLAEWAFCALIEFLFGLLENKEITE